MPCSFEGDEELGAELAVQLSEALGEDAPDWHVVVMRWRSSTPGVDPAERVGAAVARGCAVVVLVADDDEERQALEAGAAEAVRWPASPALLAARVRRAARIVRLPWLESVARMVNDSLELTDTSVRILDVNPAFERITGYARTDALGKTTGELFRSEKQDPSFYHQIEETITQGEVWRGQFTARRQDGSLSFQSVSIAEARDATGRTVGHVGLKRDTSRDDLAWSALENAESRTRELLENAGEAVLVHGFDGSLADVNPAACRLLGMERAELLATRLSALCIDCTPEELAGFWAGVGAEPVTQEARWRRSDGREIAVEISVARTRVSGSELLLTVARDVSERREARLRLEAMNTRLEETVAARTDALRATLAQRAAVLDNLADGLLAVDALGRVEMWNPAFETMVEGLDESWRGAPIEGRHDALAALVHDCIRLDRETTADFALVGERTGRAVASPIHVDDDDGTRRGVGAVVLVRDVTLAAQVDRMKTDFIATVSHELRTPLTSVLGFAKLARTKLDERVAPAVDPSSTKAQRALAQVSSNLEIIVREGKRLSELIDDVLDISKMEAGRVDWESERIDPAALVDQAIEVTAGLFTDDRIALERQVEDDLPELVGDRARLLQVIINLISNAVKFTSAGSVQVSAARGPDGVRISVSDTGIGVPVDQRDTIFEKFRQARDTLAEKPRGTGLGLPICKHIVEHHGGRIWIEDAEGGGTRFSFVIPRAQLSERPAPHPARALAEQLRRGVEGREAEILVVDDDPGVRELLRQMLEEGGHRVRTAADGVAAVAEIRESRPDLVILDVLMPGLSGFDVAALLRSDPDTRDLPIVILSVITDPARSQSLGIDRYLTKPLKQEDLLAAIRELAGRAAIDPPPEYTWVVMSVEAEA